MLIAYIHYIAPVEEQNFGTLITFLNAMEVREDDDIVGCTSRHETGTTMARLGLAGETQC